MNEIPAAGETFRGDDGTISTVLPASYGQDYEASEGELEEYAEYIGIDPTTEPELMWIAQEGLRAPLPDWWRACQTDDNQVYYFNFQTGESLWDHPMDERYKEKVVAERAKHRKGGGGGVLGAASAAVAGPANLRTGTTKALTDSLFLKPSGGVPSAATTPSVPMDDGASAPRPSPDVSDILSLAATVASPLGPKGTRAIAAPYKLKEAEAALRKRLEEQKEAQLRALRIDYGRKEDAERQRLEEAKSRLQRELDSAWTREKSAGVEGSTSAKTNSTGGGGGGNNTATQRQLQTTREVKQIEESWSARLLNVSTRVKELQRKADAQQEALHKSIYQPPEELRKSLEARNAAEIAQLREAAQKKNDAALQRVKSEHAAEQARISARVSAMVTAAEKLAESSAAQKVEERKVQSAAMIAALQAAVETKQAELAAKETSSANAKASVSSTGVPSAHKAGLSDQEKAVIAAAQAAADAEVAAAKKANNDALAQLEEEYEQKKKANEAMLPKTFASSRAPSTLQTPTRGLSRATSESSLGANTITPAEQAKLDEEDQKLKEETEKAARIYSEETELMVANKEAGRPLTAVPLAAAAANVSAEAVAALGRTATQNQRARDAENARHSMAMKQLETKHEQAMRLLQAQHEKSMASASTASGSGGNAPFNPRQHPSFTAQLNARKRSWIRDHPAPSMEMPTLTPIPTLPTATIKASMDAAATPDEDEEAKILKTRLTQTREELRRKYDREMQTLQRAKESELAAWQSNYRTTRLAEVQRALETLKREKETEVATAKGNEQARADAATRKEAEEKATSEASAKLRALEDSVHALEVKAANGERESKTEAAAVEAEIAELEKALLKLTSEVETEERRREEQRSRSAAVEAETEILLKKQREAPALMPSTTSSSPALPSTALFIDDAAAIEEENTLRTRWTGILNNLRTAIKQEMENYERAEAEGTTVASQAANVDAIGRVGVQRDDGLQSARAGSLPPTGPSTTAAAAAVAATQVSSGPTYQSSLIVNGGTSSLGFTTPLQRPPLSFNPDNRSFLAENGGPNPTVRLFAPSLQQQQRLSSRTNASPAPSDVEGTLSAAGDGMHYHDPTLGFQFGVSAVGNGGRAALPMPHYRSAGAEEEESRYPFQPQVPFMSSVSQLLGQRAADPRYDEFNGNTVKDDQAMRLAALQQAVRERRHKLQARRREMEQLREEWKEDMRLCKERGNKVQARHLRGVKEALEERARQLNKEVLELKAMQHEVQGEARRYGQWMHQQKQQVNSDAPTSGSTPGNATPANALGSGENEPRPSAYGSRGSTADMVGLLESMVARTERLEKLLQRNTRSFSDHSPSPGRDSASR